MNFLDSYDIAPRTPTPNPADAPPPAPPSLNEEVNEVIGQLGRFWGGFRKQVHPYFLFKVPPMPYHAIYMVSLSMVDFLLFIEH